LPAADLLHFGHARRQGHTGIGAEAHLNRDNADRRPALRSDVVDILGRRDRSSDGGRDKALDQLRARAGIGSGDGNDRFLDLRILSNRKVEEALEAEEQDQQAEDRGQNRPTDEEAEIHCSAPPSWTIRVGSIVLSIFTGMPLDRRFWPAVTTISPAESPFTTSTIPSRRRPDWTNACFTTYCGCCSPDCSAGCSWAAAPSVSSCPVWVSWPALSDCA